MINSDVNTALVNREGRWKQAPTWAFKPDELELSANLVILVKGVADMLMRHYPGWDWAVAPDEGGGITEFFSLKVGDQWYRHTFHTKVLQEDPTFHCVIGPAGDYLKRFGFKPGPYSYEVFQRGNWALGQFIPDVSDLKPVMQKAIRTHIRRRAIELGHAMVTNDPVVGALLRKYYGSAQRV